MSEENGLRFEKHFTKGFNPNIYEHFEWENADIEITDDNGNPLFLQKNIEVPLRWSQLARKIVASKYFYGDLHKGERENSVKQLIERVSRTMAIWGLRQKYFTTQEEADNFKEELSFLSLDQRMAFNSPVWFNVGIDLYDNGIKNNEQKEAYIVSPYGEIVKIPIGKEKYYPQTSACFIQEVKDTMESIMELAKREALLFKYGSGTGTNLSTLRSSRERLSGGGKPSGPLAYWSFYDKVAGIVKSGGKTRRAAKMDILNISHPDILEFIKSKREEEKKLHILIDNGIPWREAVESCNFQNTNISVRVTDDFMKSVSEDKEWKTTPIHCKEMGESMPKYRAKDLLKEISEGTHFCGDPGLQFHDTINKWHTCPNSGIINASNPCVTGDTKVLMKEGKWRRIDSIIDETTTVLTNTGIINKSEISGSFKTGSKPVYKLKTKCGYEIKLTADHKVFTVNRGFVQACELTKDDLVLLPNVNVSEINEIEDKKFYQMLGVYLGYGCFTSSEKQKSIILTMDKINERKIIEQFATYTTENYSRLTHKNTPAIAIQTPTSARFSITNNLLINKIEEYVDSSLKAHQKRISDKMFNLSLGEQKYILQGLFTADGTVANYGEKSQYVALDSTSLGLLKDVQILLLGFGIKSKIYENRRAGKNITLLPDGKGGLKEYHVKEVYSLRISRTSRIKFEKLIGFMPESLKNEKLKLLNSQVKTYEDYPIDNVETLDYVGVEEVFDLKEPLTHTFVANGITIHNCSEYMFIDNSSCNLASLNLMRFLNSDGSFNVEDFSSAVRTTAIAQDLEIDNSSYPTKEIAENSHKFRPLGMGYANLGSLLMFLGIPYDSYEARAIASSITALLTGKVYEASTEIAEKIGTFSEFEKNKESLLNVMNMHKDSLRNIDREKLPKGFLAVLNEAQKTWENVIRKGEVYGFRNAQATVLAPTGTIGFMMDCDTKGIEPEIGLVQVKLLSDGGTLKLVNSTVRPSLMNMGYDENQINGIIKYVEENETIEEAPYIKEQHLAVFDCANKPSKGKRTISYQGHLKMMAAVQPFISGAISKTVNLPKEVTVEEIETVYIDAWKSGLKAVALYRDQSKRIQPLNFSKKEQKAVPVRKKMPVTRNSITHKFDIAGHEGYITIGMYEDGIPGETFITMSKEGSTIGGLMDGFATSLSMNLQYGVPLQTLVNKFKHQRFEPKGIVWEGHPEIKTADSVIDYIFTFLEKEFLLKKRENKIKEGKIVVETNGQVGESEKGGLCPICGEQMIKKGHCTELCEKCNYVNETGCGG